MRQLDRVRNEKTTDKNKNSQRKITNNKHENRNNPTYPAGAGRLWGWIWWSSLVSFFLLNAYLRIWSIFRLKKKKRKGTKQELQWIHWYAQSWVFRDYSILLSKIGKFCIANSRVSPPTILRTQTYWPILHKLHRFLSIPLPSQLSPKQQQQQQQWKTFFYVR